MPKTNATQPVKKRDRIGIILYLVYFVMLLGAVLLTVRIIGIQLFFRPEPEIAAKLTPKVTERSIEPERGRILDCNGRLLAISCPEYQFYMDCTVRKDTNTPEEEKKWRDEARELSKGLAKEFPEMTADQFYRLIMTNRNDENKPGRKYIRIGHPVDRTAYNRILSLPLFRKGRYYSGVQYEQENVREYPYDELARRTIGFVRNNKSPVRNTHIGLEGKFDYELHGKEGREYLRETDQGTVRNNDSTVVRAVDGNDLRSTLNIDYQEIADFALREQIEPEAAIEGACLVLMEVKTGAIRAMVNLLREGEEHTGPFSEIQNLAIGRKNEPGSVFKTVTLTALLNDGYIRSLEETLPATDGHVDGTAITDKHIPDYARDHNTDKISIIDGFKISSNYVFAKLAVGKVAPDFAATRPNGDTFSLYGVPAKYKLLVFWASDDAASRQANPSLIRLYQQFRPRGLEIVGISLDGDLMAWRRAIEQDGISIWTNGSDLEGRSSGIASLYMVGASLPYTVLIGEDNKIIAKGLLGDDLTRQLNELTKKKKK